MSALEGGDPGPLGLAALEYAGRGVPVFPLRPAGKAPIHPGGFHNATTDLRAVERTWRTHRTANIGAPCGVAFDVLDVDGPVGEQSLAELDVGRELAEVPQVRSGREDGGRHLFFAPSGLRRKPGFRPKLDYLGLGGYVILPPSVHPTGAVYRWTLPIGSDLPTPPPWLLEAVVPPVAPAVTRPGPLGEVTERYGLAALEAEVRAVLAAPEGQRNGTLNRAAFSLGQLAAAGLLAGADVVVQLRWAAAQVGLGERETDQTIRSGFTAGLKQPRR